MSVVGFIFAKLLSTRQISLQKLNETTVTKVFAKVVLFGLANGEILVYLLPLTVSRNDVNRLNFWS